MIRPLFNRILLISFVLLCAPTSWAETSPGALAREIVTKLKESQSPIVLIDYINWDSAFNGLSAEKKAASGAANAEEYRDRFKKLFTNPRAFLQEQFEKRIQATPEQNRAMFMESFSRLSDMVDSKFAEMRTRIGQTEYKVGTEKINGDTAEVDITLVANEQTRQEHVKFVKIAGKWWLPGLQIVSDPSGPSAPEAAPPSATSPH